MTNHLNTKENRTRFMRIMLFFDLPTITANDRRQYRRFRKFLTNDGFLMLQESVYCKLAMNYDSANLEIERIRKNNPKQGMIQCLIITEKQYADIINISGEFSNEYISSTERLIVL